MELKEKLNHIPSTFWFQSQHLTIGKGDFINSNIGRSNSSPIVTSNQLKNTWDDDHAQLSTSIITYMCDCCFESICSRVPIISNLWPVPVWLSKIPTLGIENFGIKNFTVASLLFGGYSMFKWRDVFGMKICCNWILDLRMEIFTHVNYNLIFEDF